MIIIFRSLFFKKEHPTKLIALKKDFKVGLFKINPTSVKQHKFSKCTKSSGIE